MTRAEYKRKFLKKRFDKGKKSSVPISKETRTKLFHLAYGGPGFERIPISDIVENILQDHFNENLEAIKEIYKHDSPLY